jgi:hypothetical protein
MPKYLLLKHYRGGPEPSWRSDWRRPSSVSSWSSSSAQPVRGWAWIWWA